jgi:hypothetical protein
LQAPGSPLVFGGVHVAHLFSFLCCRIMYIYVLSSVLWCLLQFLPNNDVRFVFTQRRHNALHMTRT